MAVNGAQSDRVRFHGSMGDRVKSRYTGELTALIETCDYIQRNAHKLKLAAQEAEYRKGSQVDLGKGRSLIGATITLQKLIGKFEMLHSLGVHSGFGHRSEKTLKLIADDVVEKMPPRHRPGARPQRLD